MSLFDKTLTLNRQQPYTQDAIGGSVEAPTDSLAGTACSVWAASAQTVENFRRRDLLADYEIGTQIDIAAKAGDTITVGTLAYVVVGYERFENAGTSIGAVYVAVCTLRNQ